MLQRLIALAQHNQSAFQHHRVAGRCTQPGPPLLQLCLLLLLGFHPLSNAPHRLRRLRRLCIQALDGSLSSLNLLYVTLKATYFLVERHQILRTTHVTLSSRATGNRNRFAFTSNSKGVRANGVGSQART